MDNKHFLGFGLRLTYAIFMMCGAIACLICGVLFTLNGEDNFSLGLTLLAAGAVFTLITVLSFIGAIKGRTKKWGNNICIALGAIFCIVLLGIFGVVGGVRGNKAINNPELEANKKRSTGFGLRLFFGILMLLSGAAVILAPIPIPVLKIALGAVFLFVGTLGIVCAIVGKKKKWANTLSIVLGSIFIVAYLTGLFALFGGILGRAPFKKAEAEQNAQRLARQPESIPESIPRTQVNTENCVPEYIQPRMGVKGKKAIMIVTIVSYSLLLIAGILLASIPSMSATVKAVGVMWCALTPAIGYYFATVSPCNLSKKGKIILASVTTVLLIIMTAVFFIIINTVSAEITVDGVTQTAKLKDCFDGDDKWFIPLSMIFAALGLAVCHALTLFRLNPEKIANSKPEECGEGFLNAIRHVFALLVYGILGLVKFILTCKEKQPDIFILLSTVLLTWLAFFTSFVFAIICIAVFVVVIILCFTGLISFAYIPSNNVQTAANPTDDYYKKDEFTYTDKYGYEQTVYTDNGKDFYDEGGHYQFSGKKQGDKIIIDKPDKPEED